MNIVISIIVHKLRIDFLWVSSLEFLSYGPISYISSRFAAILVCLSNCFTKIFQPYLTPYSSAYLDLERNEFPNQSPLRECLAEDMRILTNKGFLFLDQVQKNFKELLIAQYNCKTRQIEYVHGKELIIKEVGFHRMIEFSDYVSDTEVSARASRRHISLLVSEKHSMFVQRGKISYGKNGLSPRVHWASKGTSGKAIKIPHAKYRAHTLADEKIPKGLRMISVAEKGTTTVESELPFLDVLGLRKDQANYFLKLYGYWLGDGSMSHLRNGGSTNTIVFAPRKQFDIEFLKDTFKQLGLATPIDDSTESQEHDEDCLPTAIVKSYNYASGRHTHKFHIRDLAWFNYFEQEYGKIYKTSPLAVPDSVELIAPKSSKWFFSWVYQLNTEQVRNIIEGYRIADGDFADNNKTLYTSSVSFRDELVHLLINAGYTAFFNKKYSAGDIRAYYKEYQNNDSKLCAISSYIKMTEKERESWKPVRANFDGWTVSYAEPDSSPSGIQCSYPVLYAPTEVRRNDNYSGRVWCVQVPSGLIFTQRVLEQRNGTVTVASRPVIIGNCDDVEDCSNDFVVSSS